MINQLDIAEWLYEKGHDPHWGDIMETPHLMWAKDHGIPPDNYDLGTCLYGDLRELGFYDEN